MAKFINHSVNRKTLVVYNISDLHLGSKTFHEEAALRVIQMVQDEKAYVTIGGDMIEGKTIDSPHFNPEGLNPKHLDIHSQCDAFTDLFAPIAKRILMMQVGNHELYLMKNFNVVRYMCERLGRPEAYGDYQTWLNLNGVTMHFWHGRPTMPRGAKDPIQRSANQKAWLKNRFEQLAGSAQAHYMAHTHQCMIVEPQEKYALLNHGENVRGVYFSEPMRDVNGMEYWHPDSRWYVNTGTFRRGGGFDHQDYSEIAGYVPPAIACTRTTIQGDRIANIEKVQF